MIRRAKTIFAPDYKDHGTQHTAAFGSLMVHVDGKDTLMLQALYCSTNTLNLQGNPDSILEGMIVLQLARPGEISLGYALGIEQARGLAAGIINIADMIEAHADAAAAAALKKAAGK